MTAPPTKPRMGKSTTATPSTKRLSRSSRVPVFTWPLAQTRHLSGSQRPHRVMGGKAGPPGRGAEAAPRAVIGDPAGPVLELVPSAWRCGRRGRAALRPGREPAVGATSAADGVGGVVADVGIRGASGNAARDGTVAAPAPGRSVPPPGDRGARGRPLPLDRPAATLTTAVGSPKRFNNRRTASAESARSLRRASSIDRRSPAMSCTRRSGASTRIPASLTRLRYS